MLVSVFLFAHRARIDALTDSTAKGLTVVKVGAGAVALYLNAREGFAYLVLCENGALRGKPRRYTLAMEKRADLAARVLAVVRAVGEQISALGYAAVKRLLVLVRLSLENGSALLVGAAEYSGGYLGHGVYSGASGALMVAPRLEVLS